MSGRARRIAGLGSALLLVVVTGCAPFLLPEVLRTAPRLRSGDQSQNIGPDYPEIDLNINASGADSIDVYFDGPRSTRFNIAQEAAHWLGATQTPVTDSDFEPDVATVQLDTRLIRRSGDVWVASFDTALLHEGVEAHGYDTVFLFVCHPAVRTIVRTSRQPDFAPQDTYCIHGVGFVVDSEAVQISMTLLPKTADYLGYVGGVILGVVLLAALAWFVGDKLRRTVFRRRSPAAVVIGMGAALFAGSGAVIATAVLGAVAGPADNLALAKDLGAPAYAGSIAGPSLLGLLPAIIFAVLMVKRRPWRDDPIDTTPRPWPAPPPPGSTGGPPPLPAPR